MEMRGVLLLMLHDAIDSIFACANVKLCKIQNVEKLQEIG